MGQKFHVTCTENKEPNLIKKRLESLAKTIFVEDLKQKITMSRICAITGKRPVKGGRIIRKGLTKKSGGIGTQA